MKFHERRTYVQRQVPLPRALLKTLISKLDIDLQPLSLFISAHQVPNMKHAIKFVKLCHCILSTCYLSTRDQFINEAQSNIHMLPTSTKAEVGNFTNQAPSNSYFIDCLKAYLIVLFPRSNLNI